MGSWILELRIALRSLARRPGFALGVALTLGLGVGATTTIYAVVDGVMLRPLPYDERVYGGGGRAKRFFALTQGGREAIRVSGRSLRALWEGMDFLLEEGS